MLNLIGDFSLENPEEKSNFACQNYQDKLYLGLVNYYDQELYYELQILVFDHLNLEWSEVEKKQIKVESPVDNCQIKKPLNSVTFLLILIRLQNSNSLHSNDFGKVFPMTNLAILFVFTPHVIGFPGPRSDIGVIAVVPVK